MAGFTVSGIPSSVAEEVRRTLRSPQYGHPAHREVAAGYGPCRHCLRTFRQGSEERILFTYQPFSDPASVPAPGPVFVHAESCDRYDAAALPPDFERLPLVFEAYAPGGRLLRQEPVAGESPAQVLERVIGVPGAAYVHIRNAEAGCFMARVARASEGDAVPVA